MTIQVIKYLNKSNANKSLTNSRSDKITLGLCKIFDKSYFLLFINTIVIVAVYDLK